MQKESEKDEKKAKENVLDFGFLVKDYLEKCSDDLFLYKNRNLVPELEIRFGTNSKTKSITKIDYDNVVKQLMMSGWTSTNIKGVQMLRITNEFGLKDQLTQKNQIRMSNIRAEIIGADLIKTYCQTNSIQYLSDLPTKNAIKFTQKMRVKKADNSPFPMIDMTDFNFRVSYQYEKEFKFNTEKDVVRSIIANWNNARKNFRCINRVQFAHPDFPIVVDISIIKTNKS